MLQFAKLRERGSKKECRRMTEEFGVTEARQPGP